MGNSLNFCCCIHQNSNILEDEKKNHYNQNENPKKKKKNQKSINVKKIMHKNGLDSTFEKMLSIQSNNIMDLSNKLPVSPVSLLQSNHSITYKKINYKDIDLLETLGTGGYGKVLKAYDIRTGEFIALKFMEVNLNNPNENRSIFEEKEILEVASQLNDELQCAVFLKYLNMYEEDCQDKNKQILIISMEYGLGTMTEVLDLRGSNYYSQEEIFYILSYLIEGFLKAQEKGICHRDIKTDNFIIKIEPSGKVLYKISDFGAGCQVKDSANGNTMIEGKTLKGVSKVYAAPEVQDLFNNYSANLMILYDPFKADVYSLGVVILQMLGYDDKTIKKIKKNFSKLNEQDLINKGYPLIYEILYIMMQSNPNQRISFKNLREKIFFYDKTPPNDKIFVEELKKKIENPPEDQKLNCYRKIAKIYLFYDQTEVVLNYYEASNKIIQNEKEKIEKQIRFEKEKKEKLKKYEEEELKWFVYLGLVYGRTGKFENCLKFYEKAWNLAVKLKGEKSLDSVITLNYLGYAYGCLGNHKKALKCEEKAYDLSCKIFKGDKNYISATILSSIAKRKMLKEPKKSYNLLEKVFKIKSELLDPKNIEIAACLSNLAIAHFSVFVKTKKNEHWVLALLKIMEALNLVIDLCGENHAMTLMILNNIGDMWRYHRSLDDAIEYHERARKISLKVFGESHFRTSFSYYSLALDYLFNRDLNQAETFMEKAIEIGKNVLGENNALIIFYYKELQIINECKRIHNFCWGIK